MLLLLLLPLGAAAPSVVVPPARIATPEAVNRGARPLARADNRGVAVIGRVVSPSRRLA